MFKMARLRLLVKVLEKQKNSHFIYVRTKKKLLRFQWIIPQKRLHVACTNVGTE